MLEEVVTEGIELLQTISLLLTAEGEVGLLRGDLVLRRSTSSSCTTRLTWVALSTQPSFMTIPSGMTPQGMLPRLESLCLLI